eukprot:11638421-Ditylum_brightwellii.AAC.1
MGDQMGCREDPSRSRNARQGTLGNNRMSSECDEEMETALHVVECPLATPLWQNLQSILFEWAAKEKAKPGIMAAINTGITQWRNGDDLVTCENWPHDIKDAFGEQTNIGWEAALKGFLSTNWQKIQAQHYAQLKNRQTGKRFVSMLIKKLFD